MDLLGRYPIPLFVWGFLVASMARYAGNTDDMLELRLGLEDNGACRILCLGAHCDDIEIGCGGTLLKLMAAHRHCVCHWVVMCSDTERENECHESAKAFLAGAKEISITIHRFQDGYLPFIGAEVKDCFESLKSEFSPDIIFTHYRHDLHQDHGLVSSLTWNTFRDHFILEYEVPKYDGDLGSPNCFVCLSDSEYRRKVDYLLRYYKTQGSHPWFCEETFLAFTRLRGVEIAAPSGHAEAFYTRKLRL